MLCIVLIRIKNVMYCTNKNKKDVMFVLIRIKDVMFVLIRIKDVMFVVIRIKNVMYCTNKDKGCYVLY